MSDIGMPSQHKFPTVRLASEICEKLSSVDSATASKSLSRYFWLLEANTPDLSESEFMLLCDACKSLFCTQEDPGILVQALSMEVEDAMEDAMKLEEEKLDTKWQVNGEQFLAKLKNLTAIETLALIEAIERYWNK